MKVDIHTHILTHKSEGFSLYVPIIKSIDDLIIEKDIPSALGIHPWFVDKNWKEVFIKIREHINEKDVVAVGESGLDRVRGVEFNLQKEVFMAHVQLAKEMKIPLVIHCVKAYADILEILKREKVQTPLLFHDYNGNVEITKSLLEFDSFFSYGDKLFRPESKGYLALPIIPKERLFLETDEGNRGSIEEIYQRASTILNRDLNQIESQFELNLSSLLPDIVSRR